MEKEKLTAVSLEKLLAKQVKDTFCENMREASLLNWKYRVYTDKDRHVLRRFTLYQRADVHTT